MNTAQPQDKDRHHTMQTPTPEGNQRSIDVRVRQLLTDFEQLREALLALSDDIWLDIDHNDIQALEEGVRFKRAYNERMAEFNRHTGALASLIQQFTHVSAGPPVPPSSGAEDARTIRELDREQAHTLDEDFRYKRPYGFVFCGKSYHNLATWSRIYITICNLLIERDAERFAALPDSPNFIHRRGNRDFSWNSDDLRIPLELPYGIYVETNLSANSIARRIGLLLDHFEIDRREFVVYLHQDRDAEQ